MFKSISLALIFCLVAVPAALAGWTIPANISEHSSYMPRLSYSDGVLHTLYYDNLDDVSYVRSTDLGQSWSTPVDMTTYWSDYPEVYASGDSVIAMWVSERNSWYYSNYVFRRSTDGGATWDDTSKVLATDHDDVGGIFSFSFNGPKVFLAYAAYDSISRIYLTKSTNFGNSWSTPRLISSLYSIDDMEIGNFGDTLYLIFDGQAAFAADYEVYFLKSMNAGQTWSAPLIISQEDNADSYKPKMSVNEAGNLAICWGASGGGYNSALLARVSQNRGTSWDPIITNVNIHSWVDHDIACKADTIHLICQNDNFIIHTKSTDNGVYWGPIDTVENNRYSSYNPAVALSPGMVHVIWDDRRYHTSGIYYSRWEEGYVRPETTIMQLQPVGSCDIPHWSDWFPNVCIGGDYAYIGGSSNSQYGYKKIIDISDPANPSLITSFDVIYSAPDITVSGNYMYSSWYDHGGLVVHNVADPLIPIFTYAINGAGDRGLCKKDSLVYIAGSGYLSIYSVADPGQPVFIGSCHFDRWQTNDVDVVGRYAYVIQSGTLAVVDVTNPESPMIENYYEVDEGVSDGIRVAACNNYLYLITYSPKVEIVNISDPVHPMYANTYYLNYGNTDNLCVYDHFLLIAHNDLTMADISDPANPVTIAEYPGADSMDIHDVDTDGEYIYCIASGTFVVFQFPESQNNDDPAPAIPNKNVLLQNYPNPFNAQTTISYNLPQAGPVTLSIYNIMGQKVATLIEGEQQAGEHKIVWDAQGVTSGVYFGRLESGITQNTMRLVLLK
jgi:hypothetical protein